MALILLLITPANGIIYFFPEQRATVTIHPLVKTLKCSSIVGSSHGLLCLTSFDNSMAVLWNISIRKAVAVVVPRNDVCAYDLGFGVCRETCDPKIVKINRIWDNERKCYSITRQVEVFTLSTRAWRSPYGSNILCKSISFHLSQVVIDGCIYWLACDGITSPDNVRSAYNLIISFDITSEEFVEINLPDTLAHETPYHDRELFLNKVRESLVVCESDYGADNPVYVVWMMKDGVSKPFTKLFNINTCTPRALYRFIHEFRKNGEPILAIPKLDFEQGTTESLVAYEPDSKHFTSLGFDEISGLQQVHCYTESLILLHHPDSVIHYEGKKMQIGKRTMPTFETREGEEVNYEASEDKSNFKSLTDYLGKLDGLLTLLCRNKNEFASILKEALVKHPDDENLKTLSDRYRDLFENHGNIFTGNDSIKQCNNVAESHLQRSPKE